MITPDLSTLTLRDEQTTRPALPDDIANSTDQYILRLKKYALSVPYPVESYAKMLEMLDFILLRLTQCIEAKDYDPGFLQWDSMLTYWSLLNYPLPKDKRIRLAKVYYHLCTTPGLSGGAVANCADGLMVLTRSKKKLTIKDMRLPWKPIYEILSSDLFLRRRQFEYSQLSWCMGYTAENVRKFFHPAAIDAMLETFVPLINGTSLDSILSSQYYLLTFLPLSHPQSYLPMLFRLWESINSYMYDERMLEFLAELTELHVNPSVSDPQLITSIPDDARSEGESRPQWSQSDLRVDDVWPGLYKDVGIFSEDEWNFIMCKCLASMEIPLADAGSLTTGPTVDGQAGFEIGRLPKAEWRISSLAAIIVYSMAPDGPPAPSSSAPTPYFTPLPSGMNTPQMRAGNLKDFLSIPLSRTGVTPERTYLAGCKALDSLVKLIASVESFLHPSNSGGWTADLSAFIRYIVYDFNRRWHEERKPDCKTPTERRLTKQMKLELVKALRTVAFLAMFSQDPTVATNIQSALKTMCIMEPELILHPVLDRAIPALETLVETERTIAVIKALVAVAPAIVSREVYYPGAKHLLPILQLLIPGIDLNDPAKTLCTTAFVFEIAQYIKFGDLTVNDSVPSIRMDAEPTLPESHFLSLPSFSADDVQDTFLEPRLSKEEEDALLKDTTASFADWVTSFVRRVIQLLENLPDEGANDVGGSETEVQVVDAVAGACRQICVHLSEPLFDLVLKMVFEYASTNVRPNAVRAVHQLVECLANANPIKTLAKFFPFCAQSIRTELEHGASSLRTTSASSPLPSDATLHWNLAILRGTVYNDGRSLLRYRDEFLDLFRLLHSKTYSKRGFSWSGKLLSSALLTLTHTYPLENKFVNPDEWESEEFRRNHHLSWGKLYNPDDVQVTWHVPNDAEIDFAIQLFKELIEPTFSSLEGLLADGIPRDAAWRNDFCRHLSFVRNAFEGIPTLIRIHTSPEDVRYAIDTSDILNEVPEMIACVEPVNSGFCITDPADPRYRYFEMLRRRFGECLHQASVVLQKQGEENTLDAVAMLISAIRTYMLEYGESRDSYALNQEQYTSEKSMAQHYANQKVLPRAVLVRRARLYNAARLRFNSLERVRGPLEDQLIDDVVEWSLWHYATIRESSQSLLDSLTAVYDGLRRRALPVIYKALQPGTDDDRMKGALWTLNCPAFAKYAISDPTLTPELCKHLFACQHNEKPSIQQCVSVVFDNCLSTIAEPCNLVYAIDNPSLSRAIEDMQLLLAVNESERSLVSRCQEKRAQRIELMDTATAAVTDHILEVARATRTHWRYKIVAIRCLRTLVRRDIPLTPSLVSFFFDMSHDSHPNMRYYAQRAIMKSLRYIKLRTLCRDPIDLVLDRNQSPLLQRVPVQKTHAWTSELLQSYRTPCVIEEELSKPHLCEWNREGWLAWRDTIALFRHPDRTKSTFQPWEQGSEPVVTLVRDIVKDPSFWKELSTHYAEENHEETITQDNVSCVKSIFQLLDDEPIESLLPTLEELLGDVDQNKQRAAAELLAGVIGGSKHWPVDAQERAWKWFTPHIKTTFSQNIKTDTLLIWTSFVEYIFYKRDPRRAQPLVDYLCEEFHSMDYNGESSFDAIRTLSLFRAFYEELNWKFSAWADETIARCWPEICSEHDDVRAYVGEILAFSDKVKWRPRHSVPTAEVFVIECRTLSADYDIMGIRGTYHKSRVAELVEKFKLWRAERVPGVRAFQSTYDRVGITVCKWLFQSLHDIQAASTFDYILPLIPEVFRFTEVNDNDELTARADTLLVRMCGVAPPKAMVDPILDAIFETIQTSASWRVRLKALPLVQVFYFRQVPLISDAKILEMLEIVCKCLDDEIVEVREMAATTLSGILRLSPRRSVLTLKDRFVRLAKASQIPARNSPDYNKAIRQRHAAILGICALVDSYPYTVEKWMPDLLANVLAEHTYDPVPISTSVRKCASNFKKTHQDTWQEDSKRFNEEQLAALSTLLTGSSYYA